jgi:hypothetical protein
VEKTLTRNTFIGGRLIEASEEFPVTIEVDDLTEGSMLIAPSTPIGNATPEQLAAFLRHKAKLAPTEMLDLIYGKSAFAQETVELEQGEPRQGAEQAPVILSGGDQSTKGLPLDNTAPSSNPAVVADALRTAPADLREAAGLSRDPPPPKEIDNNDPYARQNKDALAAELAKRPHIDATELTTRAKMIEALEADDAKSKS